MKQIIRNFNNLVEKTIFKVQNKTNNNFKISNFNKYLVTFIVSLFIYLFYLLIPILYDKTWVQKNIESKLFDKFKIDLSTSADISYLILPAPHFLIKDSKILVSDDEKQKKSIAEIKILKVFVGQANFFNKEKINIQKVIISKANFNLLKDDIKIFNKFSNNPFSNKKIEINSSNIFFKDNFGEIITIIKINKGSLFFDNKKLLNLFNLKGDIFGVPFIFDVKSKNDSVVNKKVNFKAKSLQLNILNESITENNKSNSGKNIISFLSSATKTKYNIKEKLIIFESYASRLGNSKIDFNGELSISPFDLDLNVNLNDHRISKLFNFSSILKELVKSKLLFNESLSLELSILAKTDATDELFQSAKINFNAVKGKLNFDETVLVNDKIGLLKLNNSNLFLEDNELILNTNILITIKDSNRLFSILNTNKKSRKVINNILINLDYNFLSNQIIFNNIKVDNTKVSDQFLNTIEAFSDNDLNNTVKSRRLINKLFDIYDG